MREKDILENNNLNFREGNFYVCDSDLIYKGYTTGETWNGWACPYFSKEVCFNMINTLFDDENNYAFYNEEENCFICYMDFDFTDYPKEKLMKDFKLCKKLEEEGLVMIANELKINFKGKNIKVYDMGTAWFTWLEDK